MSRCGYKLTPWVLFEPLFHSFSLNNKKANAAAASTSLFACHIQLIVLFQWYIQCTRYWTRCMCIIKDILDITVPHVQLASTVYSLEDVINNDCYLCTQW